MGVIKSVRNFWSGRAATSEPTNGPEEEKRWDDTLLAVRNGNLEEWNKSGVTNPYAQNYTVHRALQILATNIAQVPFEFYRGEQKLGPEFELNEVLRRPNGYTSNFELWEGTIVNLFLYGEAFWFLNTNNYNIIREIYSLHPNYMDHVQESSTDPISSWIYNNKMPMGLEEVVHFKLYNTGGVRGLSPLDTLKQDISNDSAAASLSNKMFKNGTKLSGVIEVDKDAGTNLEEMRRILAMWKAEHQGESNAGKVGALLGGMKYRELGQTMSDLKLIDSRDANRDRILLLLGIHKAVVGVTDKIDRATADTALRSLWQTTLKPETVRIQEKINAELLDDYFPGVTCKFDLTVVEELKKDLNDTLDAATKFWKMGYTRNEINARLGLRMPDVENDDRYIPRIMIPEDMAEEAAVSGRSNDSGDDRKEVEVKEAPETNTELFQLVSKMKGYLGRQRSKAVKVYLKYENFDQLLKTEDNRLKNSFLEFKSDLPANFTKLNEYTFNKLNKIAAIDDKTKNEKADAIKNLYKYLDTRAEFIVRGEDAD